MANSDSGGTVKVPVSLEALLGDALKNPSQKRPKGIIERYSGSLQIVDILLRNLGESEHELLITKEKLDTTTKELEQVKLLLVQAEKQLNEIKCIQAEPIEPAEIKGN